MSFETGFYYICNASNPDALGKDIGRHLSEDRSLLPKRVVNLPSPFTGQSRFSFEKKDDGSYTIQINGARLISIERKLFAALLPEPFPNQKWKFETIPDSQFVRIVDADGDATKTWTVKTDEDFEQVGTGPRGQDVWSISKAD